MNGRSKIIAVIPARYASVRLPAKPLVDLCGKPMIQHVYERAAQAKLVDEVVVATDDDRIAERVKKFGGKVAMTPSDIRSGSDRVAYVANTLTDTDIVINVQGDEPLIVPHMIDEAVQPLIDDTSIQVGTLVKKITSAEELHNPNIVKVVLDDMNFGIYFSRSPIPYLRDGASMNDWHTRHQYYKHIGLYVYRRKFLLQFSQWDESTLEKTEKLEQLRIIEHGYKIKTALTEFDSVPIDTPDDVKKVKEIMMKQTSAAIL